MRAITIGRVARETGCKVQTIRYYEQIGLLRAPDRSEGNQRRYVRTDVDRLAFIRHARDLGFSIEAIRELLHMADRPDMPCDEADVEGGSAGHDAWADRGALLQPKLQPREPAEHLGRQALGWRASGRGRCRAAP